MCTTETDRILERLETQFMEPEWYQGDVWEVRANHGETHIVPADVCATDGSDLADYVDGTIDTDDNGNPIVTLRRGVWLARLSAPGYLDCTDWVACETEDAAKDYLAETYGDDLDEDEDEDEDED
jgi:hypothetical protein